MILTKKDYDELGHDEFVNKIGKFYAKIVNDDPTPRTNISKGHWWLAKRHKALIEFKETGQCDLKKWI